MSDLCSESDDHCESNCQKLENHGMMPVTVGDGGNRLSPRGLRGLVTRVRVLFRLRVLLTEKGTDIGI